MSFMWSSPLSDHAFVQIQWGVVIGVSIVAAMIDWRRRRIPNALTAPAVAAGLAFAVVVAGGAGLLDALAGMTLMGVPFVLLFVFAGGGAGDAKLMGALGAWLGVSQGVLVLLTVLVAGSVYGLAVAAWRGELLSTLGRLRTSTRTLVMMAMLRIVPKPSVDVPSAAQPGQVTIPYGVPICLGVCVAAAAAMFWGA